MNKANAVQEIIVKKNMFQVVNVKYNICSARKRTLYEDLVKSEILDL